MRYLRFLGTVAFGRSFQPVKSELNNRTSPYPTVLGSPAYIISSYKRNMSGDSPVTKKPCGEKLIGTHNGTFHCDEVLACFLVKQLPEYQDAKIVRTRDPAILSTCDVVVDVGGVFDAASHRYDHHQRTFKETMSSLCPDKQWQTKLSSAGLVYFHFGKSIIAQLLKKSQEDPITSSIFDKVYENFVEEIDAIDNGISQTDGVPRYHISTTLSSRVSYLNPAWNQGNVDTDTRFHKAMEMVGAEFLDRVSYYTDSWLPARTLVEKALAGRFKVDDSGEILVLEEGGCPWKDHLFTLEQEQNIQPLIKFVLYQDQNNHWRVQCVSVRLGSFENRLSLLEAWRGVRDDELSKLSGIPDCIFVHAGGFIGGNKTYEGALKMAQRTLKEATA
ncbi:UPF0160 protein MYG1, mitochondrial [Lingula anatina]|uniref:UPF0160 protein MYG1, mitochondrial n=1 Tax=Lingula anatina TaxID=7574 RepID=A0A1S3H1A7_LINAN|nr:UPF0160 protein MYG1, mitochondrial [Lingula anatina]|eukprot:XP_013379722.1 UPF0160 protein MYG1, mitochondrial [Lingula anatina]